MRSMVICQPAIKQMKVSVTCGIHQHGIRDTHDTMKVFRETGLTVGDLYDVAKDLSREGHPCPECRVKFGGGKMDNVNHRRPSVEFESFLPLSYATGVAKSSGK